MQQMEKGIGLVTWFTYWFTCERKHGLSECELHSLCLPCFSELFHKSSDTQMLFLCTIQTFEVTSYLSTLRRGWQIMTNFHFHHPENPTE